MLEFLLFLFANDISETQYEQQLAIAMETSCEYDDGYERPTIILSEELEQTVTQQTVIGGGCFWNAQEQGNKAGTSFVTVNFPIDTLPENDLLIYIKN